jgi:xanthine dehydrogenase molybdopterin-binding subunit B
MDISVFQKRRERMKRRIERAEKRALKRLGLEILKRAQKQYRRFGKPTGWLGGRRLVDRHILARKGDVLAEDRRANLYLVSTKNKGPVRNHTLCG